MQECLKSSGINSHIVSILLSTLNYSGTISAKQN